jgi:isoamylase
VSAAPAGWPGRPFPLGATVLDGGTNFAVASEELVWFTPAGPAMTDADWNDASALAVAIYLDGSDSPDRAADGTFLADDDFLIVVNAWWDPLTFTIPVTRAPQDGAQPWNVEVSTDDGAAPPGPATVSTGGQLTAGPRSVTVLRAAYPAQPAV